ARPPGARHEPPAPGPTGAHPGGPPRDVAPPAARRAARGGLLRHGRRRAGGPPAAPDPGGGSPRARGAPLPHRLLPGLRAAALARLAAPRPAPPRPPRRAHARLLPGVGDGLEG